MATSELFQLYPDAVQDSQFAAYSLLVVAPLTGLASHLLLSRGKRTTPGQVYLLSLLVPTVLMLLAVRYYRSQIDENVYRFLQMSRGENHYAWAKKFAFLRHQFQSGEMEVDTWKKIDAAYDHIYNEKSRHLYDFWGPGQEKMTTQDTIINISLFYLLWIIIILTPVDAPQILGLEVTVKLMKADPVIPEMIPYLTPREFLLWQRRSAWMPADTFNEKHELGYVDLEAHNATDGHSTTGGSSVPVVNVPYRVKSPFAKEMMAEFLATFITIVFGLSCMAQVTLSGGASGSFVTVAMAWGFAYFLGISVGGGVSGAHLNPTVTVTLALLKMLPWKKVPFYILVQTAASFVSALVVYILYRPMFNEVDPDRTTTHTIFATFPHENVGNFTCFLTEFFAAALLILGILALLDQHNRPIGAHAVPPAIGVLVTAIAMGFAMNTGLAANGARDLGPRLFMLCAGWGTRVFTMNHYYFWVPLVAPILGGAAGAGVYEGMVSYHHADRFRGPYPEYRF
ncbi:hypothetical protein BBJ29_003408 [Phytophthora kernoviae]|uniref:Uncharacterized protein n=1 Tax=Phytophthora kernoviae TaxID=325452 RepID=A0A3F2RNP2_9STRA|nr:hypothetical protein BBJ29_003408 [Phytophthora kernoviae]RLN61260.1 hypothetical protein BBP00_00005490 [Phytophthora kernoviae]